MKIGISNMSWGKEENLSVSSLLKDAGFDYIESVYSKLSNEFPVKAIQSIFYDSGINNLDDPYLCAKHVSKIVKDCEKNGIKIITFGSPTMRVGNKKKMHRFLFLVNSILEGKDIKFCVEPNAKYYGAEYYNTLEQIVPALKKYPNLTSMIDVGNSILEGKDPIKEYDKHKDYVSHVHFAAKDLFEISDYELYVKFYNHLIKNNFKGFVTYEFNKVDNFKDNLYNFINTIKGEKWKESC